MTQLSYRYGRCVPCRHSTAAAKEVLALNLDRVLIHDCEDKYSVLFAVLFRCPLIFVASVLCVLTFLWQLQDIISAVVHWTVGLRASSVSTIHSNLTMAHSLFLVLVRSTVYRHLNSYCMSRRHIAAYTHSLHT